MDARSIVRLTPLATEGTVIEASITTNSGEHSQLTIRGAGPQDDAEVDVHAVVNSVSIAHEQQLGAYTNQATIMSSIGQEALDAAMAGFHVAIPCIGGCGSGKTFSLRGREDSVEEMGLINRFVKALLQRSEDRGGSEGEHFAARIRIFEINGNEVYDLLQSPYDDDTTGSSSRCNPVLTPSGFSFGGNAYEIFSLEDLADALDFADTARALRSHFLGDLCRESHVAYELEINLRHRVSKDYDQYRTSRPKVTFVDVASASVGEDGKGSQLANGPFQDFSNLVAGMCRRAANFRESALATLLQPSFLNAKLWLLTHVTPSTESFRDNFVVLRTAERFAKLKRNVVQSTTTMNLRGAWIEALEARRSELDIEVADATERSENGVWDAESAIALQERIATERAQLAVAELPELLDEATRSASNYTTRKRWSQAIPGLRRTRAEMTAAMRDGIPTSDWELRVPHLLLLHADPSLNQRALFPLFREVSVLGCTNPEKPPNIELRGRGVTEDHCVIERNPDNDQLQVIVRTLALTAGPEQGTTPGVNASQTYINGAPVVRKALLQHNDRLWLGSHVAFRVVVPAFTHMYPSDPNATVTLAGAERELARTIAMEGDALSAPQMEILRNVDHANAIAAELKKDVSFEVKIMSNLILDFTGCGDLRANEVAIQVLRPEGSVYWDAEKFQSRFPSMLLLWQRVREGVADLVAEQDEDPFADFNHVLIGQVELDLSSIGRMECFEDQLPIVSLGGNECGSLHVDLRPADKYGREGPFEAELADHLNPIVQKSAELWDFGARHGTDVFFVLRVKGADLNVDDESLRPMWRDTFIRHRTYEYDHDKAFTESVHDHRWVPRPRFEHTRSFKLAVDHEVSRLVTRGSMTIDVMGKMVDPKASPKTLQN